MPEAYTEMHFPLAGVDLSRAFCDQRPREVAPGLWSRSTPAGLNVRGYEATALRLRGGSRAGLSKYVPDAVVADWVVQDLAVIVSTGTTPVQTSLSGRVVTLVAVSQGNVYYARAGDSGWTLATNNTGNSPPLNFSGVLYSAPNNQKLYFADGVNEAVFDPKGGTIDRWTASAGSLPRDSRNQKPRLICTWRGRTVLAGLPDSGQEWFMSKVGDPNNFDYGDVNNPPTVAVAGVNSPQGLVGDIITSLIPYSDDVLIFGGDSSIYMMAGDPAAGGSLDRVTDGVGMAWGAPWCKEPNGTLFFLGNQPVVYSMVPGQQPVPISQGIHQKLLGIDTGRNALRLAWDHRFQGVWLFVTPLSGPLATTHYFWEARTNAWWPVVFTNPYHNPLCCCTFDGNLPDDRCVLIGSWDGYVRKIDPDAATDDGTPIESSVVIGPLTSKTFDELMLHELVADLGVDSGAVNWSAYVGTTAEIALASTAVAKGTWKAGRNNAVPVRRAGHGVYLKLDSGVRWALERVRARVETLGKVRARVK